MKFFGATPTTVKGVRLSVMVLPTISGSDPRLRSQKPWLRTATGVALTSSSARKPRPSVGWRPEQGEIVAGDDLHGNLLGLLPVAVVHLRERERRHVREDGVLRAQVPEIQM